MSRSECGRDGAAGARDSAAAGTERGSASIWVLACCVLLVAVGAAGVTRTEAVLARHRAEAAADLAALAAAGRIGVVDAGAAGHGPAGPGGVPGDEAVCAAARAIAVANQAEVSACTTNLGADGRSGTVLVRVSASVRLPLVGGRTVGASARAARLPAGAG